jgi:hypothetical protein
MPLHGYGKTVRVAQECKTIEATGRKEKKIQEVEYVARLYLQSVAFNFTILVN